MIMDKKDDHKSDEKSKSKHKKAKAKKSHKHKKKEDKDKHPMYVFFNELCTCKGTIPQKSKICLVLWRGKLLGSCNSISKPKTKQRTSIIFPAI